MNKRLTATIGIAVCAAAAGWSGLWFFAASRINMALEAALARESELGRQWTCRELTRSGFPFSLNFRCTGLTFKTKQGGQSTTGSLAFVNASFSVFQPGRISADFSSPALFSTERTGIEGEVKWNKLSIIAGLQSFRPQRLHLSSDDVAANMKAVGQQNVYRAASLEVWVNQLDSLRDPSVPAIEVTARVRQLIIPQLDTFTEDDSPALIELKGAITKPAELLRKGATASERVDNWAVAGGVMDIQDFALLKKVFQFSMQGSVSVDRAGFPEGRLAVGASGVSSLLRRFGVPQASLAIEGALGRLARRRPNARDDRPPQLPVPLILRNGRVYFGPVQTQIRLPRLY